MISIWPEVEMGLETALPIETRASCLCCFRAQLGQRLSAGVQDASESEFSTLLE